MARVIIESDDGLIKILVQEGVLGTYGWCPECRIELTDRGHFEDTCEAIANHLDNQH